MNDFEAQEQYQIALFNRADELLDAELAKGEAFTEGLTNWAVSQAERDVPRPA